MLTVSEAANQLNYHERTIRDMLNDGRIQGQRIGPRGKWLIPQSEINRILQKRK